MASATRLLMPCAVVPDHSIAWGPRRRHETLGPTRGAQPEAPPADRHLRISRKNPSSAGPGSDWLMRVPSCRNENSAPPSVICASSPEAEVSVVAAKSAAVFNVQWSGTSGVGTPAEARSFANEASSLGDACTGRKSAGIDESRPNLSQRVVYGLMLAGGRPMKASGPVGAEPVWCLGDPAASFRHAGSVTGL